MLANFTRPTLPALIVFASLAVYRTLAVGPATPDIVLPRNEPTEIAPRYADERVVTDEQLRQVLVRVTPPAGKALTNNVVHALRLWGDEAEFRDPAIPSGSRLRDYLLDDRVFRRLAGEDAPALFYRGVNGIEVRAYDDQVEHRESSSYHADDLLATLAETGTPLDTVMHLRDGDATVRELLETSLRRFHLEQLEYEWTAIACARYAFPQPSWRNKFGEQITVDALVDEILSQPPELGPCNGLHRLEALVVLLRADDQYQALRPRTKAKAVTALTRASAALVEAQTSEGYWTRNWSRGRAAAADKSQPAATLHDKLLVTGHHLEWLALAPPEAQPPRENVIRAAQWLARTLIEMDEAQLAEAYGPYTHAARALCLWRGLEAWPAWQQVQSVEQASAASPSHTR